MKIAFNAIRVSKKAGSGFDTFIINFLNEFARYVYSNKLNIEFDVYTLYPQHFPEVKKENIKQVKLPFVKQKLNTAKNNKIYIKKQNKLFHFFTFSFINFLADYFRMFWAQFVFPFFAKNYDLVVNLTQFEASVLNKKRQVVIVYDLIPYIFKNQQRHKYAFFVYTILPYILRRVKNICVVSNNTKLDLINILGINESKIVTIYAAVDRIIEVYSKQNFDSEKRVFFEKIGLNIKKYLLFVGSNDKRKNLENVIKAFDIICEKVKDLGLIVVGFLTNKDFSYYELTVKNFKKIKFLGHVDTKDLIFLYKSAEVFLFPTLYEGFGLPPLEAMACGCPVVVSNKGALPEVCGDAAVYVDPYDPQSIAEGVIKVLSDEKLRQSLIQKGYQQVKKFSWENSVAKFLEVLNY